MKLLFLLLLLSGYTHGATPTPTFSPSATPTPTVSMTPSATFINLAVGVPSAGKITVQWKAPVDLTGLRIVWIEYGPDTSYGSQSMVVWAGSASKLCAASITYTKGMHLRGRMSYVDPSLASWGEYYGGDYYVP